MILCSSGEDYNQKTKRETVLTEASDSFAYRGYK